MSVCIIMLSLFLALYIVRLALGNIGQLSSLDIGFSSIVGNCEINADSYDWSYCNDELLVVVANGIGRESKGRTASIAATHTVSRVFQVSGSSNNPAYFFQTAFHGANNAVLRYIPDGSAGTSILAAIVKDGLLYYALAGNCQIAVCRNGELIPLSEGHTFDMLAKKAFHSGKIKRVDAVHVSGERKVYNYLGKDSFKDLELFDVPVVLKKGDRIVLMTDGIFDFHPYVEMEPVLASKKGAASMAHKITQDIERENYQYQDNATIAVIKTNSV